MSDPQREVGRKALTDSAPPETEPENKEGEQETLSPPREPDIDRVVESMPPEIRRIFRMGMMGFSSGPMPHPLIEKFNEEHIHKFLDYTQQDDENDYRIRRSNRWFNLTYAMLGLGVFIFLVV